MAILRPKIDQNGPKGKERPNKGWIWSHENYQQTSPSTAQNKTYPEFKKKLKNFSPKSSKFSFQGLAAVFNISLGIVSWWTSKESERYNRLIQLRVFVFCVNILHAYITGPIIYQNDDTPILAPGTKLFKFFKIRLFLLILFKNSSKSVFLFWFCGD